MLVNGKLCKALRDTGASALFVDQDLVPAGAQVKGEVTVTGFRKAFTGTYPVVLVSVELPFYTGDAWAISVPGPLFPVLVGNTLHTPHGEWLVDSLQQPGATTAAPVVTRARAKAESQDQRKTSVYPDPTIINLSKSDLVRLQQEDDSLGHQRRSVSTPSSRYFIKDGVLYRRSTKHGEDSNQLVVPQSLRPEVLRQGHDRPLAGHMGVQRTLDRIQQEFFWPRMGKEIREWVRTCDVCQRSAPPGWTTRVPLGTIPSAETPFQRVAIDLAGPMSRTHQGNAYVLCVVDYATRYPEAVPLRNIEAATVAEALFEIYSRLGFPEEAVTDQGSQFTSDLYKEMCKFEGVERHTTSPYHPQSNGLVERFNRSFKHILRKLCQDHPKDWDRFLPAVLFSYRDVPQESTGFSPFELLYGRTVRGPMTILRRLWTQEAQGGKTESEERTMGQYVLDLRNRVEETCKLAQRSVSKAHARSKEYYDRHALDRSFEVGDQVLLLRPVKGNKLSLAWRGPFTIKERVGEWNYRVSLPGKNKVYHANMLKQYYSRSATASAGVIPPVVQETDFDCQDSISFIPLSSEESWRDVSISSHLTQAQRLAAQALCEDYSDVLTDRPLRTHLQECELRLTTTEPVRVRPYPIPHSQRETVQKEVQMMLDLGVIERSDSPYCSPIVLVRKKDGKTRFCIDFRRLNRLVEFDSEPMPDVNEIFSSLSDCQYFSKLDLSKGYWQIPMAEASKPLTAFSTPEGEFQWRAMPFGLKTAGAVFSRMMRKLLHQARDPAVHNFIDDVLLGTPSWEHHLSSLKSLFSLLRKANLSVRPTKCLLGYAQLSFLGYEVGQGMLMPEADKVEKIRGASRPETKKQVRSFLGLAGFYRKFIPHFAEIALPLTNLTKGGPSNKKVTWDETCEASFVKLKELLCSSPILRLPDSKKPFVLRTDASTVGLGAALGQEYEGTWHPVQYASKKLTDAETRYSTIELECYAVVWGIRYFYPYLYGRLFYVECDHHPLSALHKIRPVSRRLVGWSMELQSHQFEVRYIQGSSNVQADFLSRNP